MRKRLHKKKSKHKLKLLLIDKSFEMAGAIIEIGCLNMKGTPLYLCEIMKISVINQINLKYSASILKLNLIIKGISKPYPTYPQ